MKGGATGFSGDGGGSAGTVVAGARSGAAAAPAFAAATGTDAASTAQRLLYCPRGLSNQREKKKKIRARVAAGGDEQGSSERRRWDGGSGWLLRTGVSAAIGACALRAACGSGLLGRVAAGAAPPCPLRHGCVRLVPRRRRPAPLSLLQRPDARAPLEPRSRIPTARVQRPRVCAAGGGDQGRGVWGGASGTGG